MQTRMQGDGHKGTPEVTRRSNEEQAGASCWTRREPLEAILAKFRETMLGPPHQWNHIKTVVV